MQTNPQLVIPLWPEGVPGAEPQALPEQEVPAPFDPAVTAIINVTQPSLTVYQAEKPNGIGVIVAPGGGFQVLAIQHEGRQVVEWLCAHGYTAFLLKYRTAQTPPGPQNEPGEPLSREERLARMRPLEMAAHADGLQAVRIVRQRAAEWGVDPAKVGLMGFSAGGILVSMTALDFTPETRPDFAAVIYGAMFREFTLPENPPPLFLLVAQDDPLASGHTVRMYQAWKEANLPVEMHIYAAGSHGFGMRKLGLPCDTWIERFDDWAKSFL